MEKNALNLFRKAAREIPAYKDFLKKNKFDPDSVRSFNDFGTIPTTSKKNYLRNYPLKSLCWNGTLSDKSLVFAATSGSTGDPFYFPRSSIIDNFATEYHESFLKNANIKGSTLVMDCFGMGVWIGGIITYQAFRNLADRGRNLTIITPGVNKKEIFAALEHIAPLYDNLILCAYPPFLKDIADEAKAHGVDWKKFHVYIVCAAESFSERFRDYIINKMGVKNPVTDIMNIYGTADNGVMGTETPLTVAIRRSIVPNSRVYKTLFAQADRVPTFAQYDPNKIHYESINYDIFFTADNALPFIRYEIGDYGGLLTFEEVKNILAEHGINMGDIITKANIERTVTDWPFIYVYDRIDLATKLYGAIIYPEHVKEGIAHDSLEDLVTGKFTMSTKNDRSQNEYLEINVELRPHVEMNETLELKIAERISKVLLLRNAEHRNNFGVMQNKVSPRVKLWEHEHPKYFKPGIKQKWVRN